MSNNENVTDRHDESDTAQFGDDPHHLADTPFEETTCTDCNTYIIRAKQFYGECRCLTCARTHQGITWGSGEPIGTWHPALGYPTQHTPPTPKTENTQHEYGNWNWACIYCLEQGTALNAKHATAMHQIHLSYACPNDPGITPTERNLRQQRRAAHTHLYPQTTPPT